MEFAAMKAKTSAKEIRKLKPEEIDIEVARFRRKLFELRTQAVTEKIQDTSQYGKIRKDLARLLTAKNARKAG